MDAASIADEDLRDPDARIPLAAEIAMWQTIAKLVTEPGFGIHAAAPFALRRMGLVGYLASFSATLRGAMHRVERYAAAFTDAVVFRLHEGGPDAAFLVRHPALGRDHSLAQDYSLTAILQASRELTGVQVVPTEVSFTYGRPSTILPHREFFRCPLRFAAPTARIVFHRPDLDLPVARADEVVAGYLSKYAEQVLAAQVRGDTMQHALRAAIWAVLGDGRPSLARVAAAMRLRPRTLQRRLAAEGTSLHKETEAIRKTMAMATLRDRELSIDDIAYLLGFSEPSAFFRAFKRWTGTTPQRFRRGRS